MKLELYTNVEPLETKNSFTEEQHKQKWVENVMTIVMTLTAAMIWQFIHHDNIAKDIVSVSYSVLCSWMSQELGNIWYLRLLLGKVREIYSQKLVGNVSNDHTGRCLLSLKFCECATWRHPWPWPMHSSQMQLQLTMVHAVEKKTFNSRNFMLTVSYIAVRICTYDSWTNCGCVYKW